MKTTNVRLAVGIAFAAVVLICWTSSRAAAPPGPAVHYKTLPKSSTKLRVHIIDIGAGDAILIETPNGDEKHVFIDGGKNGVTSTLKPYLKHFVGANRIDVAIVTHPDYDHIKGMAFLFDNYDVYEYWDTGYDSPQLSDTWRSLQTSVGNEETCASYTPISECYQPGERVSIDDNDTADPSDDVTLQFVNVDGKPPFKDPKTTRRFTESERRNNASLVLKLVYKNVSFLLTGDINGRRKDHIGEDFDDECESVERFIINLHNQSGTGTAGFLKATVLKAPHHGSNGSSSLDFIKKVNPEWVVFSAGHEYDHPHPDTLRRYQKAGMSDWQLLRTDEGDSTPEDDLVSDKMGDDTLVFETDGTSVTQIHRLKISL